MLNYACPFPIYYIKYVFLLQQSNTTMFLHLQTQHVSISFRPLSVRPSISNMGGEYYRNYIRQWHTSKNKYMNYI